ncbi:hypothetical protein NE237_020565 [Protea cynaroides]|uniref:Uncharacterized protein n=1 Tax=Protea cynaroides TaxID=273540 RepID=A0A9Q0H9L7_9MAGN|nr:hypothetical protein NE237_020565 [Protea cynaroides]
MVYFLCRELCHMKRTRYLTVTIAGFLQKPYLKHISTASASQDSFVVSCLKNHCGLSKEAAIVASKRLLGIDGLKRLDSLRSSFRNYGFTDSQISKIIRGRPKLLFADWEKSIKPKIDFFCSICVYSLDVTMIVTKDPNVLGYSLKNQLLPSFEFIRSFAKTSQDVVKLLKKWGGSGILQCSIQPNFSVLQDQGVPKRLISMLLVTCPVAFTQRHDRFNEIVKEITGMGLDPSQSTFIKAIRTMVSLSKSNWKSKFELYKRLGWSENELLMAFRKQPMFILVSEKKIKEVMNLFGKKMGLESSAIARYPGVFLLSLEKRTIPRCLVLQILITKGLIKKDLCLAAALIPTEERFLKKFVTEYQEEAPQLLKVYQRGLERQGLAVGFDGLDEVKI